MNKPQSPTIVRGGGYPPEFRQEAVAYWFSSGKRASEVAAELNVSGWSLNRWRKELESQNADPATATGELNALELAKENGRLRRENESLARQRDILKKAISIFSADNPLGGSR